MFTYSCLGINLQSQRPILALRASAACAADTCDSSLVISTATRRDLWAPRPDEWLVRNDSSLSVARVGDRLVLHSYCRSAASFDVSTKRRAIDVAVVRGPRISRDRFEHTLLHGFVPNVLAACGDTVFHAASVVIAGKAFLFSGDSGMGKSTLAAGFAARGHSVLAEDIARVEWRDGQLVTFASYPGARLRSNSFLLPSLSGNTPRPGRFGLPKFRVLDEATPRTLDPFPVGGVLLLRRARHTIPRLRRLRPTEAMPGLMRGMFLQALPRDTRSREAIERAARVWSSVPVLELTYRRSAHHFERLLDQLSAQLSDPNSIV